MVQTKKKLHPKDKLVLTLIAITVSVSFLVSLLAQRSVVLNPIDSELGQEAGDASGLIINEIMTSNNGAVADSQGNLYDWIELYNGGNKEIKLMNYGLSDTLDKTKWVFHDIVMPAKSYLIVYLAGAKNEGPYASFRLQGGGGETLVLRNPGGNVLASYQLPEIQENQSIGRNSEGKWVAYRQPTPGFENSVAGYESYLTQRKAANSPLKITEILPRNQGNFLLDVFKFSGYVEITNISDKTIDLKDYYLGESADVPFRWRFPSKSIQAGKSLVVYTSGKEELNGKLSTNFRLNDVEGSVLLSDNQGRILDQNDYKNIVNGYAVAWQTDRFVSQPFLSPGFSNDTEGVKAFNATLGLPKGLIINEAMNNNTKYLPQNGGNHYDWIELKNNGKNTLHLGEYTLSTTLNAPNAYKLPNVDLSAGETYILMASGDVNLSTTSYKHAGFKLGDVESLYLFHQGEIVDSAFMAEIPVNYSYARSLTGGFTYSNQPTPDAPNKDGMSWSARYLKVSAKPASMKIQAR